jgi:hypothetical protein
MDAMCWALRAQEALNVAVLLLRENNQRQWGNHQPRRNRQIRLVAMRLPTGEGVL